MSAAVSLAVIENSDHLPDGMARRGRLVPVQVDPIETQKAVCESIAHLIQDGRPEIGKLDALLALERQAQAVNELLLSQYVEGDLQVGSFEWKAWNGALQLNQSLFQANEYFLHHLQTATDDYWGEHEPLLVAHLFHHKKVEFLLRLLRYKKHSPELWRQLHEMYRVAYDRGLLKGVDAGSDTVGKYPGMANFERQYLQVLLLEAMNNGRFSPRDALWAYRWFSRWCSEPDLRLARLDGSIDFEPTGFVVDLGSSFALERASLEKHTAASNLLYLDTSPLRVLIDREMATLRDATVLPLGATAAVRAGQLALLNKLAVLFAPKPIDIERRAERKPVTLAVQAIVGFPCIVDELSRHGQKQNDGIAAGAAPRTLKAMLPLDGPTFSPMFSMSGDASPISLSMSGSMTAMHQVWQVKDRSDSGCRMRAQIGNLNRVIPGSLIAVRDGETAPWVVSVVRWFRRLMVDYVEIGVEYLGREPRFVKMVTDGDRGLTVVEAPNVTSKCFAALYFPPSEECPTMPIKTLLLPACEFRTDSDVTLLSSDAIYRMRLNEPIQQQFEYVWTSFAVIDRIAQGS